MLGSRAHMQTSALSCSQDLAHSFYHQVTRHLEEPIDTFLAAIGVERYCESFTKEGFVFVSDLVLAQSEEVASVIQGMQEPEQRRLRDAIDNRKRAICCGEATVEVLFEEWKLSAYTQKFGEEGYALVSDLLHADKDVLDKLTLKMDMRHVERSRLERNLEGCRPVR
jgi:hypothetical protein